MITVIYSARNVNNEFKNHIINTIGVENPQIIEYVNNNEFSLSKLYNKGIEESIYDIVVVVHDDVKLENGWGEKLLLDFENNPQYGIIGKAGTAYFSESGVFFEKINQTMVGQVYHIENKKKILNKYSLKFNEIIPVVSLYGMFISFNKKKIVHKFDESIGKFTFYDHTFCINNLLGGVYVGVTFSFSITHETKWLNNKEFLEVKNDFIKKYMVFLPMYMKPQKIFYEKINETPLKMDKKIAIIILTKNNNKMLFECINSYIDYSNTNLLEIFIGDTGSTEKEIKEIEHFIKEKSNIVKINLIKYDYYNFAKINNDIVRNHIDENFEYLLFSNNDIKILNNVIYGMVNVFLKNKKVGTVGARMHYEDNTIQHNGIIISYKESGVSIVNGKITRFSANHHYLGSYYNYCDRVREVCGNTAGLMMIKKDVFKECGYFNENYISCFEDVELNLKCVLKGLKNYNDGSLVAYHYESQTRNKDNENINKMSYDFLNNLSPFLEKNKQMLINKKIFNK